jgi:hypothetical protein
MHTIFPESGGLDGFALVLAIVTFYGMVRWNWNLVRVVLAGAVLGLARGWLAGG